MAFLAWITQIFPSPLTNPVTTRIEIRHLLVAFLDARDTIIKPKHQPSQQALVVRNDLQESQDEYGVFELDLEDPDLLAALEEPQSADIHESRVYHALVSSVSHLFIPIMPVLLTWAKIMGHHICPAIYHFICKSAGVDCLSSSFDTDNANQWVTCWVRCAKITVEQEKKVIVQL